MPDRQPPQQTTRRDTCRFCNDDLGDIHLAHELECVPSTSEHGCAIDELVHALDEIAALRAERDELATAILAWKDNEGRTDLLRAAARKLRRIGAPNA